MWGSCSRGYRSMEAIEGGAGGLGDWHLLRVILYIGIAKE